MHHAREHTPPVRDTLNLLDLYLTVLHVMIIVYFLLIVPFVIFSLYLSGILATFLEEQWSAYLTS